MDVAWVAGRTADFSGADLAHLCESAAELALAHAELINGMKAEARATAERLRGRAPAYAPSHEILGLVALEERNWREAEAHFRRALAIDPESATSLNNLALVLGQGKATEAIHALYEAVLLWRALHPGGLGGASLFSHLSAPSST